MYVGLFLCPFHWPFGQGYGAWVFCNPVCHCSGRVYLWGEGWSETLDGNFLGFAGTLVIVRPGFVDVGIETIVTLGAAFGWAGCMMIIKDLGKTESAATITAYMSLVMAPIVLIPALFVWTNPTLYDYAWLIVIGLLGGLGQLSMANALKQGEAQVVLPIEFSRLIWIAAIAFFAFGEIPDLYVWIGGGMIIVASTYITLRESRIKKKAVAASP